MRNDSALVLVGFGSFAMASSVENPMVETKLRGLALLAHLLVYWILGGRFCTVAPDPTEVLEEVG